MIVSLRRFLGWLVSSFSCRVDLVLENLLTFGVLYCFFVIGHDRRKIVPTNNPI
jgi:hypothetical protein